MHVAVANPPTPRRAMHVRRFPPEVLDPEEVRALLDACNPRSLPGRRNRALLAFLYRTGLRIREALEVRPKDLDLDRGEAVGAAGGAVRVLFAKGGRSRTHRVSAQSPMAYAATLASMCSRILSGAMNGSQSSLSGLSSQTKDGYRRLTH